MRINNKCIKTIVITWLFFYVLGLSYIFANAIENFDESSVENNYSNYIIDSTLKPVISAPIVDINTPIIISFDNTNVVNYDIETNGLIATETIPGSMEYDIVATEEFGVFNIYATYPENVVIKSSVYTYMADGKVYISDISKDQAWYEWLLDQIGESLEYAGEYILDVAQELYYDLCGGYTEEYTPSEEQLLSSNTISGKTVIQGKLFWEEDTNIAPLIKVNVQLIKVSNGMTHVVASQYSKPDGSFKFVIDNSYWDDNGENIFIRWWLEAETFKVTNNWILDHYCFQSSLSKNVIEGTVENFYYIIPEDVGLLHYKATYVHQAMTITERFAIDMGMTVPNYSSEYESRTKLNVSYPALFAPDDSGYSFGNDIQSLAAIGTNRYDNVDMITHEYGHYVQYLMDIYGANLFEIICNGPQHSALEDHMIDNVTKEYAMELTWSEAWASIFSTLAEQYFWNKSHREYEYFDDNNDKKYGVMSENSCLGWDSETPNNSSYDHDNNSSTPARDDRGEFQEMSIEAVLWDLYDDSTLESFDQVSLGYQKWWSYTTQPGMYTLEDFTQYIENNRPDLRNKLGKIMSNYKISPEIVSVSDCNKTQPPTITWIINGSEEHPNNRFEVIFYDVDGNFLAKTEQIKIDRSHGDTYSYPICESVWNSVLEQLNYECDKTYTVNVVVSGYRYDLTMISNSIRSESGPYLSAYMQKTISNHENFEYIESNETHHNLICYNCDNQKTSQEHKFEYIQEETYHSKICVDCGYSVSSQSHNFAYRLISDLQHEKYCVDCGYIVLKESHVLQLTGGVGNLKPCQLCGAMVNVGIGGGGGIFPVDPNKENDPEGETE